MKPASDESTAAEIPEVELTPEQKAAEAAEEQAFTYEQIRDTLVKLMPEDDTITVIDRAGNSHEVQLVFGLRQSTYILAEWNKFTTNAVVREQIMVAWAAQGWFGLAECLQGLLSSMAALDMQVNILNLAYPDLTPILRSKFNDDTDIADAFEPKQTIKMLSAIVGKSAAQALDPVKMLLMGLGVTETHLKSLMATDTPE